MRDLIKNRAFWCFLDKTFFKKHKETFLFIFMILLPAPILASEKPSGLTIKHPDIIIIAPGNTTKSLLFKKNLDQRSSLESLIISTTDSIPQGYSNVIITIGARAFHETLTSGVSQRLTIATFISRKTYFKIINRHKTTPSSNTAIFTEIPLDKQIKLAKSLLPESVQFSTLIPKHSSNIESVIRKEAKMNDLEVLLDVYETPLSLKKLFDSDIFKSTFILALNKPQIFNARSLRHILLKGYRNNISVIGPNDVAVRSGSLASVYFPIEEIVRLSTGIISQFTKTTVIPPPQNAQRFNFMINMKVAHSLNINIPAETYIKKTLKMNWPNNNE